MMSQTIETTIACDEPDCSASIKALGGPFAAYGAATSAGWALNGIGRDRCPDHATPCTCPAVDQGVPHRGNCPRLP